jgi:hypothetical protein
MKNLLFIAAMILAAGCSTSQPTHSSPSGSDYDSDVTGEKAAPAPGTPSTTIYTEPTSTPAADPVSSTAGTGRGCKTPLGPINDGGSVTGYMTPTVPIDQVCVSDTITCKNGTWSGKAIYPTCKIVKPKVKK